MKSGTKVKAWVSIRSGIVLGVYTYGKNGEWIDSQEAKREAEKQNDVVIKATLTID